MPTLHQRLAALVMPRLDAAQWSDPAYRDNVFSLIDRGVRAFGIFQGTLEETMTMLQELQRRAGNRLFFGADHEFGLPMRISEGGIAFPRAMALGRTLPGITEHIAHAIAHEMTAAGLHWNWAPVADINSDPENPIVNTRAFGEDPETVSTHAAAFVKGLQHGGVLACAKHAPGHGATRVDSHVDLPTIDVDRPTAEEREFVPFKACIEAGVGSLMMGHIVMPALDPTLPASLSPKVVTDLIRAEWGFGGLITTDALDMGAITSEWTADDAAVRAILAGCDVVLLPQDANKAIDGLIAAFDDGRLSEERLVESEVRWTVAREQYGKPAQPEPVDQNTHAMMALKTADGALELVGDASLLPISEKGRIAAFAVIDEREADTATTWFHYLAQATELEIDFGYIDGTIEDRDLQGLIEGTEDADLFLFAFFGAAVAHRGRLPGFDRIPQVMEALATDRPRIIIAAGSPYGIEELPADLYVKTYSDTVPSLAASVLRLIGRVPA